MNTRVTIPDIPNAINPIPSNKSNIVAEVVNVICGILRLLKKYGGPSGARTLDLLIMSQPL